MGALKCLERLLCSSIKPQAIFLPPFLFARRKVAPKKCAPATILIRHARSSSVHFRNSGFALRQSEMFNPRTRSPDGNVRMGEESNGLKSFYPNPALPGTALRNSWGTRQGLRQRPAGRTRTVRGRLVLGVREAEFARASGRGLRRVRNFVQDVKGKCKKEKGHIPPHWLSLISTQNPEDSQNSGAAESGAGCLPAPLFYGDVRSLTAVRGTESSATMPSDRSRNSVFSVITLLRF